MAIVMVVVLVVIVLVQQKNTKLFQTTLSTYVCKTNQKSGYMSKRCIYKMFIGTGYIKNI